MSSKQISSSYRIHTAVSYRAAVSLPIMFGDLELSATNLLDGYGFQERLGVEMGWKLVEDSDRKGKRGDMVS